MMGLALPYTIRGLCEIKSGDLSGSVRGRFPVFACTPFIEVGRVAETGEVARAAEKAVVVRVEEARKEVAKVEVRKAEAVAEEARAEEARVGAVKVAVERVRAAEVAGRRRGWRW